MACPVIYLNCVLLDKCGTQRDNLCNLVKKKKGEGGGGGGGGQTVIPGSCKP